MVDTDRTHDLLAALKSDIERGDYFGARERLEDAFDIEFKHRLATLAGTPDLAKAWGVSERRARAHLATIHERHSVGILIGGAWFIPQNLVAQYGPGPIGRPRKSSKNE